MRSETLGAFMDRLAAAHGDPGGGAAGGVVTATAAALAGMVCGYTPADPRAAVLAERLRDLRAMSLTTAETDGAASAALGAALARDESDDRDAALVEAAARAAESSAELGRIALEVWTAIRDLSAFANPHLASDLSVAGGTVAAGIGAAVTNLRGCLVLVAAHGDSSALESSHRELIATLTTARSDARALSDRLGEP